MNTQLHLNAFAKVNLGLDVVRRREDGYHDVSLITGYPEPPKQRMPRRDRHHIAREHLKEYYEAQND